MKTGSSLDAARSYFALGWQALALCPPHHRGVSRKHLQECGNPGKVPLGSWRLGKAPTPEEVYATLRNTPGANVGVVLGKPSGVVGLDVDSEHAWEALQEALGSAVDGALAFRTARGLRLLYAMPGALERMPSGVLQLDGGAHVELLGDGRQTVMPPSIHAGGSIYAWVRERGPWDTGASPLPAWVLLQQRTATTQQTVTLHREPGELVDSYRNVTLFKIASTLRRYGSDEHEVFECLSVVNRRCDPPLEEGVLRTISKSVQRYAPGGGS